MRYSVIALIAIVTASAAGCGESAAPKQPPFTYGTYTNVITEWDPGTANAGEIIALNNIYETLTRYDPSTGRATPLLAESIHSSKGGRRWTFQLRKNVIFHTGRPVTAAAAKAAIERTIRLGKGTSYIWAPVKQITAEGPTTLRFDLKYAAPLDLIASAGYSAFIYDTKAAANSKALHDWFEAGHDAGSGPYTVDRWSQGDEIELRLSSFARYWRGWSGSHFRDVVFRVVPTATTTADLLRSGQLTFAEQLTPQTFQSVATAEGVATERIPAFQNLLAFLNTAKPPLDDARVRRAITQAIDYDGIVHALAGVATRSRGVIPPGVWGHSRSTPVPAYDPDAADTALRTLGYGRGGKTLHLTLTYGAGDENEQLVATLLKSNLARVNVVVEPRAMQWPVQWGRAKSEDAAKRQDIFLMYWWPEYPTPESWFVSLFKSEDTPNYNLAYYPSQTIDTGIAQAQRLAGSDRARATALYESMQRDLVRDAPVIPLYDQVYQYAYRASAGRPSLNPAYPNVVFVYDTHPR